MTVRAALLLAFSLGAWSPAWAEVSIQEVLAVCTRALAAGYDGMDAVMCDWYVRPCGVCGVEAEPAWCVPASRPGEALARDVVTWLQEAPSRAIPAKPYIEERLKSSYPCP